MPSRRPGRPKAALLPPTHALTRRVRRLVDEAHLGNLREAAAHTRLPYATLRDLYLGRSTNPGLRTVTGLAAAYGLPASWLADYGLAETPLRSIDGILPPDPEAGGGGLGRRIAIPLAAWQLARLFVILEPYLRSLPPSPHRPILGGVTDHEGIRQRLTGFLLGPLLDAQAAGVLVLLGVDPPFRGGEQPSAEQRGAWIETLRALGRLWERALAGLIRSAESGS